MEVNLPISYLYHNAITTCAEEARRIAEAHRETSTVIVHQLSDIDGTPVCRYYVVSWRKERNR